MMTVLPDHVSLTAKVFDEKVDFCYVERFAAPTYLLDGERISRRELLVNGYRIVKEGLAHLPSIVVKLGEDYVEVQGCVPRTTFGNMMATEFFGWGSIGEMRFRDLLLSQKDRS